MNSQGFYELRKFLLDNGNITTEDMEEILEQCNIDRIISGPLCNKKINDCIDCLNNISKQIIYDPDKNVIYGFRDLYKCEEFIEKHETPNRLEYPKVIRSDINEN